jgi:hypothetical protein
MPRLSAFFGTSALLGITLRRFPLPVALAGIFTVLQVLANHGVKPIDDKHLLDVQLSLALGFFWALSAHLAARARAWPVVVEWALALAFPLLTFAILWGTPNDLPAPALLLGEAAILTTLAAASPALRVQNNEALWRFTSVALEGAAIALVAAVILAIGLCVLVFSITYLFELRDPGRLIPDIWIVSLSLFWPLRALSTLPRAEDPPETLTLQFHKALPFLLDWALVPIWIAYLAVLYTYAAKILIDGSLPRGNVAWMVHGFGALGVAVWLMVWPRRDSGTALTRLFQRWFWWTLPIPLLLLAIGILERVGAYGWTEPRYMVALGGVWLAAMALIYGLRPSRVPLAVAPLSLAALCLLSTFGPWGAVSVSVRDQHARLARLLAHHGILVDGGIVPVKDPAAVPTSDAQAIGSAIDFLSQHDRFDLLEAWYGSGFMSSNGAPMIFRRAQHVARSDAFAIMGLQNPGPARSYGQQVVTMTAFDQPAWLRESTAAFVDLADYPMLVQLHIGAGEERKIAAPESGTHYRLLYAATESRLTLVSPRGDELLIDLTPAFAHLQVFAGQQRLTPEQSKPAIVTVGTRLRARVAIQSVTFDQTGAGFEGKRLSILLAISDPAP